MSILGDSFATELTQPLSYMTIVSDTSNDLDDDVGGLGFVFDDAEISAINETDNEDDEGNSNNAVAKTKQKSGGSNGSNTNNSTNTSPLYSEQPWVEECDVTEHDAVINHPRRQTMEGQQRWISLRGKRRIVSDDEALALARSFEVPKRIVVTLDGDVGSATGHKIIQPRLLYRVNRNGQYKCRKAMVPEIRTNVNAKRSNTTKNNTANTKSKTTNTATPNVTKSKNVAAKGKSKQPTVSKQNTTNGLSVGKVGKKMTLRAIISGYFTLLEELEEVAIMDKENDDNVHSANNAKGKKTKKNSNKSSDVDWDMVLEERNNSTQDFKKTLDAFLAVPYTDKYPDSSQIALQGYNEITTAIQTLWDELRRLYTMDYSEYSNHFDDDGDDMVVDRDVFMDDSTGTAAVVPTVSPPRKKLSKTTATANSNRSKSPAGRGRAVQAGTKSIKKALQSEHPHQSSMDKLLVEDLPPPQEEDALVKDFSNELDDMSVEANEEDCGCPATPTATSKGTRRMRTWSGGSAGHSGSPKSGRSSKRRARMTSKDVANDDQACWNDNVQLVVMDVDSNNKNTSPTSTNAVASKVKTLKKKSSLTKPTPNGAPGAPPHPPFADHPEPVNASEESGAVKRTRSKIKYKKKSDTSMEESPSSSPDGSPAPKLKKKKKQLSDPTHCTHDPKASYSDVSNKKKTNRDDLLVPPVSPTRSNDETTNRIGIHSVAAMIKAKHGKTKGAPWKRILPTGG